MVCSSVVVFTMDELETALRPVFNAVWMQEVESFPFRTPVDPIQLEIPVSVLTCVSHMYPLLCVHTIGLLHCH